MKIGFIGLGNMGAAIAPNLVKAGHEVAVWNRSPEKADSLVAIGARRAATPYEAGQAEAVFTMLADDAAVESVLESLLSGLPAGGLHISLSTISVALADRLSEAHAARGQHFVSAPVFGRPPVAAEGKLFIAAAGSEAALARALPLLEIIGQTVRVFGDTPSAANLVKLTGNFLIVNVTEALGEAMALVAKGGVDKADLLEFLTSTLFSAPIYRNYGALIVAERFEPAGFAAGLAAKDMRLAAEAAQALEVPMPLNALLRERLSRLVEGGEGHLDLTALSLLAMRDAHLK
ncbi:NAD(P)-dependent oxidoreductase [Asticcacaulis sp. DW145]|uniref:NAD(P)-dependent oxidoreductase n=1 Tax=Asticcacaulis currens TaxID=2984210 RepID=A0ABT5IES9_9CAUL|nr:NAD(P)-dependent oxidoreductase [Asticcacaulis currens]MDC7694702.1 NAD(P)-dependent oxidoreductase [Asticcacaulis currens]BEV11128.1 NAD(P)-dependent oxidoreductase [Asticcacaulis sp. DW145]